MNKSKEKLDGVTILRFFAAFYVFIFHINMRVPVDLGNIVNKTIGNGVIGMSMFFILSGFVLTYNYHNSLTRDYFRKRIARIYPAYLFCGVLTIPFLITSDASPEKMLVSIGLFLTGMQAWIYQSFEFWNFSGTWSISVELFFYALFPVLLKYINKDNVVYVLVFSYLCTALMIPFANIMQGPVVWSVYYAVPLYRIPEFVIGISIAIMYLHGYRVNKYTLIFGVLLFLYATTQKNDNSMGVNFLTAPAIAIILLYLAGVNFKDSAVKKWMVYMGDVSYSFYLMQLPMLYYLDKNKDSYLLKYGLISWVLLFIINTMMAAFCHRFIETNSKLRKLIIT